MDTSLITSLEYFEFHLIKMFERIILFIFITNKISHCAEFISPDHFICVPGLMTLGATYPKGDIMLKEGDTLEINCTIDLSHRDLIGRSSKDIQFVIDKHEIPDNLLEKSIIDNSTAMVRIKNMNASTPLINCLLENPSIPICQNQVDVGYLPQPVENLHCVARDWASLNCTWTKPHNNIFTSYNISFIAFRNYLQYCPNIVSLTKTMDSCEWNGKTEPHYRPNMKEIPIVVTGINYLQPEGVRWQYEFHNWEIIIPSSPNKLNVEATSPHQIDVRWSFRHFALFGAGLNHRVIICPIQPIHECLLSEFKSNGISDLTRQFTLPFAYTKYRVEVTMKSQRAKDTPEFWSPPAIHQSVETLPKQPEFSPRTGVGTFEVFNKYQLRDVTLYWEKIPSYRKNGSNFHFQFKVFEDNLQRTDIRPEIKENKNFAIFRNLSLKSYRFEISSVNSEGESPQSSIISLPSNNEVPKEPGSVSKVDYTNGTYEISWQHSISSDNITSYTVYRCHGIKVQCDELAEWIDLDPQKTHYIFHNLDINPGSHVFAVSVNTGSRSSGMVVASCELIHDKIPGKLKDVSVSSVSSNTVEIKWGLDCSFKPGLVQGFRITYCEVKVMDLCTNQSKKDLVASGNSTSFSIENLQSFSKYIVWISMVTRAGESQSSDPILVNTSEAAPSDPPKVTTITTTNTSAILEIESPIKTNGVIQKYEIFYHLGNIHMFEEDDEKEGFITVEIKDMEWKGNNFYYFNLTNLETNSNYTVRVRACTVSCSNTSEPLFIQTKFGYTKFTSIPAVTYENGRIYVSWKSPTHLGGPIEYFELLVRKNGEESDPRRIEYNFDRSNYMDAVDLKCDTNTNITARVRAISLVETSELYGDWSPEGTFNCYGSEVWFIWILIVIASLISFVMLTFVSIKCWSKIKVMHSLDIILPPGIQEFPLDGFSEMHSKRLRQNSGGDTHSYGKENLISQSSNYNCDDSKDSMSSDSKEREKQEEEALHPVELDLTKIHDSLGNENRTTDTDSNLQGIDKCPIWLWQSSLIPRNEENDLELDDESQNLPFNNNRNVQPSLSALGQAPNSDGLLANRISPSLSNPLNSESSLCNSGDEDDDLEHYRTLDFDNEDSPTHHQNGVCHYEPNIGQLGSTYNHQSPHPNYILRIDGNNGDYGNHMSVVDHNNEVINQRISNPSNNSAYVKWTSLKTDPILAIGNGKAPYCQVGILLEQ